MLQREALTGIGDAEEAVGSGCQPCIRFISLLAQADAHHQCLESSAEIVSLGESVSLSPESLP
jgi:hypothetical protein